MPHTDHSQPHQPPALKILTHLQPRMKLSSSQKNSLENLRKGYEGEWQFYKLLEKELTVDSIPLYSLLLETNQSEFQIDSLLILHNTIYLFNVKNHEGDFYLEGEKWYSAPSSKETRDPFLQLNRSEFLFRQLLQQLGYNFSVESYLVYVNPQFFLYQAPMNKSIIYPNQLHRFIKKLNIHPEKVTNRHNRLATQLCQRHKPISAHERLPMY